MLAERIVALPTDGEAVTWDRAAAWIDSGPNADAIAFILEKILAKLGRSAGSVAKHGRMILSYTIGGQSYGRGSTYPRWTRSIT